ncbi:MAG: hypothetical protein R3C32_06235 [Chloroflexota bacterium]
MELAGGAVVVVMGVAILMDWLSAFDRSCRCGPGRPVRGRATSREQGADAGQGAEKASTGARGHARATPDRRPDLHPDPPPAGVTPVATGRRTVHAGPSRGRGRDAGRHRRPPGPAHLAHGHERADRRPAGPRRVVLCHRRGDRGRACHRPAGALRLEGASATASA